MIDRMKRETRVFLQETIQMAWFMRGSIQYESLLMMTATERQLVGDFIEENMEVASKSHSPVY